MQPALDGRRTILIQGLKDRSGGPHGTFAEIGRQTSSITAFVVYFRQVFPPGRASKCRGRFPRLFFYKGTSEWPS